LTLIAHVIADLFLRSWPNPEDALSQVLVFITRGAKRRAAAAESRWQSGAVEQFGAAVRKKQRDGDA